MGTGAKIKTKGYTAAFFQGAICSSVLLQFQYW